MNKVTPIKLNTDLLQTVWDENGFSIYRTTKDGEPLSMHFTEEECVYLYDSLLQKLFVDKES